MDVYQMKTLQYKRILPPPTTTTTKIMTTTTKVTTTATTLFREKNMDIYFAPEVANGVGWEQLQR